MFGIGVETTRNQLKQIVASLVVLAHYEPSLPLRWQVDAFEYGTSAILSIISKERMTSAIF